MRSFPAPQKAQWSDIPWRSYKVWLPAFLICSIWAVWFSVGITRTRHVVVAVGNETGDAFRFVRALKDVMEDHRSFVRLDILETAGSSQNVQLLATGKAQLATVQADVMPPSSAKMMGYLFPDVYLLVVRADSDIDSVEDLRGKRVAVPSKKGGQYASFWFLAQHYGLHENDLQIETLSSEKAFSAMRDGRVDALFRVRAVQNPDLQRFIQSLDVRLVPIAQGAAMQLKNPAIEPGIIPQGAYEGFPPLPEVDLPTVQVQRLLLANRRLDSEVAREIASYLFGHRRQLSNRTVLAGFVRRPDFDQSASYLPTHPGVQAFLDREEPSFIIEYADFFALLLSMMVLLGSSALGLRARFDAAQKNLADGFTQRVIAIYRDARDAETPQQIGMAQDRMMDTLADMVDNLDKDRVSAEGYAFFSDTWRAVNAALIDRRKELARRRRSSRSPPRSTEPRSDREG